MYLALDELYVRLVFDAELDVSTSTPLLVSVVVTENLDEAMSEFDDK